MKTDPLLRRMHLIRAQYAAGRLSHEEYLHACWRIVEATFEGEPAHGQARRTISTLTGEHGLCP